MTRTIASRPAAAPPANGLDYVFGDRLPPPGGSVEVAPGVHWLRMPLPFALDHINLWLLEDGPGWTLVDCGLDHERTRTLWEQVFQEVLAGRPITTLVVTHYHADHIGLAGWHARRWSVPVWTSEGEFLTALAQYHEAPGHHRDAQFALFRAHGLDEVRIEGMKAFAGAYRRLISELPQSYRRILPGDVLTIGGREWQVQMGYGHAQEHVTLYCPDLEVFIGGDMVLPKISTNVSVRPIEPDGDPLGRFLQSLEHFSALPHDTLVLPSHGQPFRGIRSRVEQLQRHHAERLDELVAACAEPRCARELVPVLFRRTLDDRAWYFAMGECIAHLNHLMHTGTVRRSRGDDGILRFTAIR